MGKIIELIIEPSFLSEKLISKYTHWWYRTVTQLDCNLNSGSCHATCSRPTCTVLSHWDRARSDSSQIFLSTTEWSIQQTQSTNL